VTSSGDEAAAAASDNASGDETAVPTDLLVACTMEAMVCPDGSFAGRTGPDCEFEPCPGEEEGTMPPTATMVPTDSLVACTLELFICPGRFLITLSCLVYACSVICVQAFNCISTDTVPHSVNCM